ncbi:MAG: DUF1501 domain-containing protein [Phycisphaerae bacterium]
MSATRRDFLKSSIAGATLMATCGSLPGFLCRTALAATPGKDRRTLVVIQLSGGNDGLNTVIPFADDLYQKARPTLRIGADRALRLSDTLGLHPEMTGMHRLHEAGLLQTITNVGYPNPDRSHFRSMDIWHTASMKPEGANDGWLGRLVDRSTVDGGAPQALHVSDESLPLALRTRSQAVPSIRGIDAFRLDGDDAALRTAIEAPRGGAGDDLLFVQRVALSSCDTARRIEQVVRGDTVKAPYPDYGLARRLQQIAQLISADFGPRVYYTSLGGFDTHARQQLAHGPLLRELSDSTAAFVDDLKQRGQLDRVLVMTFSEFGRRLSENASQGTDHGAAAPMFLAGSACRAGVLGEMPDLRNLDEGDVRHKLDFRSVYATVLDRWLEADARAILGESFKHAAVLRG